MFFLNFFSLNAVTFQNLQNDHSPTLDHRLVQSLQTSAFIKLTLKYNSLPTK